MAPKFLPGVEPPFQDGPRRSGIGASRPLRRIPAIVSFMNPQPALSLVGGVPLFMVESGCGAVALGRTYLLPPLSSGGASLVRPWLRFHTHRVTGGGRPPPVPTERGVRISRTTLFGSWFTALRAPAAPGMGGAV